MNIERCLFRGKQPGEGEPSKREWLYGYGVAVTKNREYKIITHAWPSECPTELHICSVDASTIGQCTGVRDTVKSEVIYEADFVKFGAEVYLIKFGDGCFWIAKEGYTMELHTILGQGEIEIVGNLYDNPELLGMPAILPEMANLLRKGQEIPKEITGPNNQKLIWEKDGLLRYRNDWLRCYVLPIDTLKVNGQERKASEVFAEDCFVQDPPQKSVPVDARAGKVSAKKKEVAR